MNSDRKSRLNIQKGIEPTTSFVNYTSKGGGKISIRAAEVKYKVSTRDSVSQLECKDLQIEADGTVLNLDELVCLLKSETNDETT